jgi:hypothetical protein
MTNFISTALLLLLTNFNSKFNYTPLGMTYSIIANKETNCENNFGDGLSFFFEQIGGYEEFAEVIQVSKILKVDLTIFQDVDYNYEDKSEIDKHWHDIDKLLILIETVLKKIELNPNYYKKVKHNLNRDKQLEDESKIWLIMDSLEREKKLKQLHIQPFYYYPPDYKYLSEGRFLKDLHILQKTLLCYKKSGATKFRLEYS